ncbi:MAG TPA: hypothetical protein VMT91_07475 [Anaerolineales bacterium]|nr:hypothetical protein [Anaerolineales bacterium]
MQFTWNTLTFINLILCIAILVFGIISWQRQKSQVALYVGIAFGLFGLTHLASLLGLATALNVPVIIIRLAAYLLVTYALFLEAYKNKK